MSTQALPIFSQSMFRLAEAIENALALGYLCSLGEHNWVFGGVAGSADADRYIYSLKNLFHGLDCILSRCVLEERISADQVNGNHVGAELLDGLLGPLAGRVYDILIVHLDGLGHADGHVEDVHGDLGGMGHGCIREERHGLLAAQFDHVTATSAVCLGSS